MSRRVKNRTIASCVLWAFIFLISIFIVKICMGRIWAAKDITKSQSWYPNYSVSLLQEGNELLGAQMSRETAEKITKTARLALKKAPLSDTAFIQIGVTDAFKSNSTVDRAYFLAALNRNNRNRSALRVLMNIDIGAQAFDDALEKLDVLMRLSGGKTDAYRNTLRAIGMTQDGRDKINAYLNQRVDWGRYFVLNQINSMTLQNQIEVAQSLNSFSTGEFVLMEDKVLHENFMRRLIGLGQYQEAFRHWTALNKMAGADVGGPKTIIFNPKFDTRLSPPPFNWIERELPKYYSSFSSGEGLTAVFNDDVTRSLTNQIIQLEAGNTHSLDVQADWSYRDDQGLFFWAINCLNDNEWFAQLELNSQTKPQRGGALSFQVPAENCDWQRISLFARPGRLSQHIRLKVSSVDITAEAKD